MELWNSIYDVPDGMAQLAEFVQSFEMAKVEVFRRPF